MSWDRAKEACNCNHQCAFHIFKARKVGKGDTCLLVTRDMQTMTETHYVMSAAEAQEWAERLRDVDIEKFEALLLKRYSLRRALEAVRHGG